MSRQKMDKWSCLVGLPLRLDWNMERQEVLRTCGGYGTIHDLFPLQRVVEFSGRTDCQERVGESRNIKYGILTD